MAGFTYEHNLPHQEKAARSVLAVFSNADKQVNTNQILASSSNPRIALSKPQFSENIKKFKKTMISTLKNITIEIVISLISQWKPALAKPIHILK